MLICDICGEEVLLEEDLKTHLLLSHVENHLQCPLCSLSGVSYDELSFHISAAHPEQQQQQHPDHRAATVSRSELKTEVGHAASKTSPDAGRRGEEAGCSTDKDPGLSVWSCSSGEELFGCPVCSALCSDSSSLQEHVELHFQHEAAPPPCTESSSSDLTLATLLQQQEEQEEAEEQRRRQQEAQQEREEFKKLQRQFGVDGRGGYRRQMERTLERAVDRGQLSPAQYHRRRADMMESLSSGIDDGATRTQGVVAALQDYYRTEGTDCLHVWLSVDTDHYCSSAGDTGWGCGYRNFQMLLSALHRSEAYASVLQEKLVPSIPRLQRMIEEAWKEGLDPQGASHFNRRLQGTQAWIGATEIYVLLTSLRISARIVDFHRPTGPGGTHPVLFDWVKQYFNQSSISSRLQPRLIQTSLPPLYLQHQGHSRSVVGVEQKKDGTLCLLLLDPGCSLRDVRKLWSRDAASAAVCRLRKSPRSLKHQQYQVVAPQGQLTAEDKQISISNSRMLRAERIP